MSSRSKRGVKKGGRDAGRPSPVLPQSRLTASALSPDDPCLRAVLLRPGTAIGARPERVRLPQKSMSGAPPPALSFFSGMSATSDSVVSTMAATLAAFCRAERVTLAGSTMPLANMST